MPSILLYIDFSVKIEMSIFGLYLFSDNVISLMAKAVVAKRGVCQNCNMVNGEVYSKRMSRGCRATSLSKMILDSQYQHYYQTV